MPFLRNTRAFLVAPCQSEYCENGGTCSIVEVGTDEFEYQCECTRDYTGQRCESGRYEDLQSHDFENNT